MTTPTPNDELFDRFTALTYDDVVVVPGYADVLPSDVDTSTNFARYAGNLTDLFPGSRFYRPNVNSTVSREFLHGDVPGLYMSLLIRESEKKSNSILAFGWTKCWT